MKVFLSHTAQDKPAVEALGCALAAQGFDPWLDKWEILGGDDIVGKINQGLSECDAGLIIYSEHTADSRWVTAETSFLILMSVERGRKLIPVKLGDNARIPPLLESRVWCRIEDVQGIANALRNRADKNNSYIDVFISHSQNEMPEAKRIAEMLSEKNINVWLNDWHLIPGESRQTQVTESMHQATACAVLIGQNKISGWFEHEIQLAITKKTKAPSFRIIPIILPQGDPKNIPGFLLNQNQVDFRGDINNPEALRRLICGIHGKDPGHPLDYQKSKSRHKIKEDLLFINELLEENLIQKEVAISLQKEMVISHLKSGH